MRWHTSDKLLVTKLTRQILENREVSCVFFLASGLNPGYRSPCSLERVNKFSYLFPTHLYM
jgi:hypothetical protein